MAPKVSVILPVYNRPDSLGDACRSVLDQSYEALELIVVDDASEIDPADTIAALGDPRVRLVRHEVNGGPAVARNTGLAAATGEFIAFQDSDDLWLPGRLARQVALLESLPDEVGVVSGGKIAYGKAIPGWVVYAPDPDTPFAPGEDQVKRTIRENRLSVQNALFRRDCTPDTQWFDPALRANEDWDFALRLLQHTRLHEDPEPALLGFDSDDSVSSHHPRQVRGHLRILRKNRHLAKRYPRDYGRSMYTMGRGLANIGRPRAGRPIMRQGAIMSPGVFAYLARTAAMRSWARLRRLLTGG